MKKSILTIIMLLTVSQMAFSKSQINDLIPSITPQDNPRAILVKTDRAIRLIYQRLGLGKIQIQINSSIHEIQKELVVSQYKTSESTNLNSQLNLFLIGSSFNYDINEKTHLDITKVITTNPSQVLSQNSKAIKDLETLKKNLKTLMENHEKELILLKELGIIQASAVLSMIQNNQSIPWEAINKTLAMVKDIDFSGSQTITRCLTVHYASTKNYKEQSENESFKLRFLFFPIFSLGGKNKSQNYYQTMAHTEKECRSSTNIVKMNPENSVFFVNMSLLDIELNKWIHAIEAAEIFRNKAPAFPTWDSPYYQ